MDESLGKAVRAAAELVNPKISRSCPLSDLVNGLSKLAPGTAQDQEQNSLVQRLVLYSKAPPAMMHVNHLLSCSNPPSDVDDISPSQKPDNLDHDKFLEFFTPHPIGITSKENEKKIRLVLFGMPTCTDDDEHDILRDALLEAYERLVKQFGSLSPTPREFLMRRLAAPSVTIANNNINASSANEDSLLDITFTNVIENSLVKFEQSNDRSSIELVEFIVAAINDESLDFSTKMVLAERLIFCLMPHPDASAGSRVLLECFRKAIHWVRSERELGDDTTAMEALVADIDRLGAGIEVKELLKLVMRETLLLDWEVKVMRGLAIAMKMKFKVKNPIPENSSNSEILKQNIIHGFKS